jgi:NDP-sugar pyrophosphorylase family protein
MTRCRQAVILAAGRGSRLAPLTDDRPKCLVEIRGRPLLDLVLDSMASAGIAEVVLVLGYRADSMRSHLASRTGPPDLVLVDNPRWRDGQNIMSLHLVRDLVAPPFLLVDGDVWLRGSLLSRIMQPDRMALASLRPEMSGTMALVSGDRVVGIRRDGDMKTVNAASFSATWWNSWFAPALDRLVSSGHTGEFYEAAIADALASGAPPLEAVIAAPVDWFEIDTVADLAAAHTVVASAAAQVA